MDRFIITLANGFNEYPLNVPKNKQIDLTDFECRCIGPSQLNEIRSLALADPDYKTIVEILEQGLELHIWRRRAH